MLPRNHKNIMRTSLAVMFVVLLAVAVGPADAITDYGYSGDACRPENGSEAEDFDRGGATGIENVNAGALRWVRCPIAIPEQASVDVVDARVQYDDQNGDADGWIQCLLYARTETGTLYTSASQYSCPEGTESCSSSSGIGGEIGDGELYWTFSTLLNGGSPISNLASLQYRCALQEDQWVMSYRVHLP
jgi:hypothetical protein